jgi:hypothetical protein
MKEAREIAFGFVIFFIIDRLSRLLSAIVADRRNLSELEMERMRCSIEISALLVAFFLLM